jgi:hypothetical protein
MEFPLVFKCITGSKLYGTDVATSDTDIKGVYISNSLDEYMRRTGSFDTLTPSNELEGKDKEEYEYFYIQRFAHLLAGQQSNNVSMLFCPKELWLESSQAWEDLVKNRNRLVSKNVAAYAGYSSTQAKKYTLKGENLRTAEDMLRHVKFSLDRVQDKNYVMDLGDWGILIYAFKDRQGFEMWTNKTGEQLVRVAGKSFSRTTRLSLWVEPLEACIKRYGHRAHGTKNDLMDLKAMMHAFRICREAKELLTTGELKYPSQYRDFYLKIRTNDLSYDYLQDMLDTELAELEQIRQASKLPETGDTEWLKEWAIYWQRDHWGLLTI